MGMAGGASGGYGDDYRPHRGSRGGNQPRRGGGRGMGSDKRSSYSSNRRSSDHHNTSHRFAFSSNIWGQNDLAWGLLFYLNYMRSCLLCQTMLQYYVSISFFQKQP